jgi:hypothetical protein
MRGGAPVEISVAMGLGDGQVTEIVRGDLAEGDEVILDIQRGDDSSSRNSLFRFGL